MDNPNQKAHTPSQPGSPPIDLHLIFRKIEFEKFKLDELDFLSNTNLNFAG